MPAARRPHGVVPPCPTAHCPSSPSHVPRVPGVGSAQRSALTVPVLAPLALLLILSNVLSLFLFVWFFFLICERMKVEHVLPSMKSELLRSDAAALEGLLWDRA